MQSTKPLYATLLLVILASLIVYIMSRPQEEALQSPTPKVELVDEAQEVAADEVAKGLHRTTIGEELSGDATTTPGTHVLRVIFEGVTEEEAREASVTVHGVDQEHDWPAELQVSWPSSALTNEFDLGSFFADVADRGKDLRMDELEVHVDHPRSLLQTARVSLTHGIESENGQTVFEVRVRLLPAAVLYGRLTHANGTPAADGFVGAILLKNDFPIIEEALAVECDADGAFEIRVPVEGNYALASYEERFRPTTTRVEAMLGMREDVGVIVLEAGHVISGLAIRQGMPLPGSVVSSDLPMWKTAADPANIESGMKEAVYEGRTFGSPERFVHLLWLPPGFTSRRTDSSYGSRSNGAFELPRQWVKVDATGAFAIRGLGDGEYLLRLRELAEGSDALPGYWGHATGEDLYHINGDRPSLIVQAPEDKVMLTFGWTSIRFEFSGDHEGEDEGRLVLKAPSGNPTPVDATGKDLRLVADPLAKNLNFTPEFLTEDFALPGNKPTYVLQAPSNTSMTGEIAFPGRQPVALDFRTPEPGAEIVIPIPLVRAKDLATLVIGLENPIAVIPKDFTILLWRDGFDDLPPEERPVESALGQLRVDGIHPGRYRVRVRAGVDGFSKKLFHENEFHIEMLPDQVITRSLMMYQGAGLRLTVLDESGALLAGEYEFFNDLGGPIDLNTQIREGQGHWASSWSLFPHGVHESFNELQPGKYRLLLRSPGYAEKNVTVELRAGEYEEVEVIFTR